MKKTMPEYIVALSDSNYEILEDIFEDKYKKFLELYWLIRNYSEYITSLKYKDTKKDVLKIELSLTNIKIGKVLDEINDHIKDNSFVLVSNEGKVIRIEITQDESVSS